MAIVFENNSIQVSRDIVDTVKAFLSEAGGEIQASTMRNSRVETGQTRGSYSYSVSDGKDETTVAIGSNLENAIWEEYGTGEYALKGDGRKGGWSYQDKQGTWHHTYGKTPNRPLFNAYESKKDKISNQLMQALKEV